MHVVTTVCVFVFVRVCVCVCVCMFIPGLIFNTWFPSPFILPILVLVLFLLLLVLIVQLTAFVPKRLAAPNLKECEYGEGTLVKERTLANSRPKRDNKIHTQTHRHKNVHMYV